MPDIEAKIAERVDEFVAELRELVRQAALEAVTEVLEQPSDRAGRRQAKKPARPRGASGKKSAVSRKKKGGRRSADDIAEQAEMVKRIIDDNPDGVRADQISSALGVETQELVLPIKKLLADKTIRRSGQRRATRYFPKK